jgi:hypothetical protein
MIFGTTTLSIATISITGLTGAFSGMTFSIMILTLVYIGLLNVRLGVRSKIIMQNVKILNAIMLDVELLSVVLP